MAKPTGTVELRIFVDPQTRNDFKAKAASRGLTITELFMEMLADYERRSKQVS